MSFITLLCKYKEIISQNNMVWKKLRYRKVLIQDMQTFDFAQRKEY